MAKEEKEISEEDLKNMSAEEIAELQKQNCIFCKIAAKEIPAKIIHEDANVMCILDINPAAEGHLLVFPKKHYMILPHLPEDIQASLFKTVKLMSTTLLRTLQSRGTTVFIANGMAAGQRAPHVIIHVFPRKDGDNLVQLPHVAVPEDQINKISSVLRPYFGKLFGAHIKTAEFQDIVEQPQANTAHPSAPASKEATHSQSTHASAPLPAHSSQNALSLAKTPIKREAILVEEDEDVVSKESSKHKTPKKESSAKSAHPKIEDSTPPKKLNLDDISRLFS